MVTPPPIRRSTRRLGVNQRDLRRLLVALYLLMVTAYAIWRPYETLNWEHPVYAWIFYLAELTCIIASVVFYIIIVDPPEPRPAPLVPEGLEVDILIATYNEDVDLLRRTAAAAKAVRYPHRTWLCDDGHRPEVEALADTLGIGYLTRPDNRHFKAGNLNNALAHTRGDIVVVLDADHVPHPHLLERTLGYFSDPSVALVQTPQVYYNIDSYQHHVSHRRSHLWHEAAVFHHIMQPAAERLNAAFFVGTGALVRRSALDAIGGFATGTITEDIHTSMRLHAAGYRSVYVDEALGLMLAPDTPLAYMLQRLR